MKTCVLYGDNKTNIIFSNNTKSQACIKHIDVQHYYIKELVVDQKLSIK